MWVLRTGGLIRYDGSYLVLSFADYLGIEVSFGEKGMNVGGVGRVDEVEQ